MMGESGLVTPITRSRTLQFVALYALLVAAYSAGVVWLELHFSWQALGETNAELHTAIGLVLGLLLVFRTNTAYSRWWEARTLWGQLVNTCRNLAIKAKAFACDKHAAVDRDDLERLISDFPVALRDHLRDGAKLKRLPGFQDAAADPQHVPGYLALQLYMTFDLWRQKDWIGVIELRLLDEEARQLMNICGGCERIRNTRVVRSYRIFARQCVILYLGTLPWAMAAQFGWWTVPMAALTSYFMIGLETVSEHVEEPFGRDEDDLDLDGLCVTIADTVDELLRS
jgi:putative membrane protein